MTFLRPLLTMLLVFVPLTVSAHEGHGVSGAAHDLTHASWFATLALVLISMGGAALRRYLRGHAAARQRKE